MFRTRSNLYTHRLETHGKSKQKCRYHIDNSCKFEENNGEKCLFDHTNEVHKNTEEFECNTFKETFQYKSQFLKHRKAHHPETVPVCKSIKKGTTCSFGDSCGFLHKDVNVHSVLRTNVRDQDIETNENFVTKDTIQNFQTATQTMKPPDQLVEIKRMMQTMMTDILELKQTANK